MKLIFILLVKQLNIENVKIEIEIDVECEIYKSFDRIEIKVYIFKEFDINVFIRIEFINLSLNIFRDVVILVFKFNKKIYDFLVYNENN